LTAPPQYLFAYADALTRTNAAEHAADVLRKLTADITAQGNARTSEINSLFLWANYLLGVICERAGDWKQAAAAFAQVDDSSAPSALRADALLHRAIALYRGGRSDECAALLVHQLMKRYPSKPLPLPAYAWLAGELLRAGDIVRASRVCDTLSERAGSQARYKAFAQLMQARCAVAFAQPKWDEAASFLQDLVKEGAADAACDYAAKRLLADCLHGLGKDSEAEELLHAMASQSHGRAAAEAEVALAQRLHDMGRPAEAAAVYQHALLVFDTPATRDLVAACLAGLATCEDEMGRPAPARLARQRLTEVISNQ